MHDDHNSVSPSYQFDGMSSHDMNLPNLSLADALNILDYEQEESILIVRKIAKLGPAAYRTLHEVFSQFGPVRRVLLLPSRGRFIAKPRPPSMGYVVMEKSSDTQLILRKCQYLTFDGISFEVHRFVRNQRFHCSDNAVGVGVSSGFYGSSSSVCPVNSDSNSSSGSIFAYNNSGVETECGSSSSLSAASPTYGHGVAYKQTGGGGLLPTPPMAPMVIGSRYVSSHPASTSTAAATTATAALRLSLTEHKQQPQQQQQPAAASTTIGNNNDHASLLDSDNPSIEALRDFLSTLLASIPSESNNSSQSGQW